LSNELELLAERIINGVKISKDDVVVLSCSRNSLQFAELLSKSIVAKGAYPVIILKPSINILRSVITECIWVESNIYETLAHDVSVFIDIVDTMRLGLEVEDINCLNSAWNLFPYAIFDEVVKSKYIGKRYALITSPMDEVLGSMITRASLVNYAVLSKDLQKVIEIFRKGNEIIIKNTTSNIRAKLRGVVLWDCGSLDLNREGDFQIMMPSGVVSTFPIETSVEGYVYIPELYDPWNLSSKPIKGLEIWFENGCIVKARARDNFELFKKIMENSVGDKECVGEIGVGFNPELNVLTGFQQLDEIVRGAIYIALGDNSYVYPELGGRLRSNLHWHIPLHRASLIIDSIEIVRSGKLII